VSVTKCNRVLFARIDDKAAWGSTPMSGGGPDPSCFEYLIKETAARECKVVHQTLCPRV